MSKHCGWIALALVLVLLFLSGCTRTSEAKVTVNNTGELAIKVSIYYTTSTILVGKSDIFTISWPGRSPIHLSMAAYPVNQDLRVEHTDLVLNHGDNLSFNVEFKKL